MCLSLKKWMNAIKGVPLKSQTAEWEFVKVTFCHLLYKEANQTILQKKNTWFMFCFVQQYWHNFYSATNYDTLSNRRRSTMKRTWCHVNASTNLAKNRCFYVWEGAVTVNGVILTALTKNSSIRFLLPCNLRKIFVKSREWTNIKWSNTKISLHKTGFLHSFTELHLSDLFIYDKLA